MGAPNLAVMLQGVLSEMELSPNEVDIVLDFGSILPGQEAGLALATRAIINDFPRIAEWRTMTLAAGSFPESLSSMSARTKTTHPRADWSLWSEVRQDNSVRRVPAFGDYAVEHPGLAEEIEPWKYTISGQLRYTTTDDWILYKGVSTKADGTGEFRQICEDMTQRSEFMGADFSWGDTYIAACASGQGSTGNAPTWRRIGFSHHLAFVSDQISNLS